MRSVITVQDLSYSYEHTRVLSNIHLAVEEFSFLILLGPNGGGKSTLLKLLLGILPLQKGEITYFGAPKNPRALARIGYVPQDTEQIKNFPLTVYDCVKMGFHRQGQPPPPAKIIKSLISEALEKLGLSAYRDARLNEISSGQRQRTLIARAIATYPAVLIMDEPISVIDPTGQRIILNLLSALKKNTTIIFVSHDLSVIPSYATAVACVNRTLYYHPGGELNDKVLTAAYGNLAGMALIKHND